MTGSIQLDSNVGRPLSAPLMAGTPRYLLFRNVYNEELRPPKVVPNASILFQVSRPADLVTQCLAITCGSVPALCTKADCVIQSEP